MGSAAAPPPIRGTAIDPPPAKVPKYAERLDSTAAGGVAYRTLRRYSYANVGLLANGTAYYLLLSLFALLALAYGIIAILGADSLASTLTEALNNAFPGVVGDAGIDPATLRSTGQAAGIIGLLLLLFSSLGAVNGASSSMHLVFGAHPDPRTFSKAKARHLLLLVIVAPLILVSFAAGTLTSDAIRPVLEEVGLGGSGARTALSALGLLLGFGVDVLILWILLGQLGGIRPARRPHLIAALVGAVAVGVVKQLLDLIMAWALDKPQYGAFAAPIAVLFILQLLSLVLYASACLAAGLSDADVPLDQLAPPSTEDAGPTGTAPGSGTAASG
jgi:membrane protein